jgi:hypothetical protein
MKPICLLLCSAFLLFAQDGALDDKRIVEMVRSGISQQQIVTAIAAAPEVHFDLSPGSLNGLVQAGVSDQIIKAMAARQNGTTARAPAPAAALNPESGGAGMTPSNSAPSGDATRLHTPGFGDRTTDFFAGYSYVNADTNGLTGRQSANGWESSVSTSIWRWVAAEGSVSGYYDQVPVYGYPVNFRDYSAAGGPRLNFRPVFVHALFGVDHLSGSADGISASQNSFAAIFGGGVQVRIPNTRWAIRTSVDYALTRHNITFDPTGSTLFGGPRWNQNSIRVSAGIVYVVPTERGMSR